MFARLRSRAQDEKGFTLIELLVVVLIIGILAAIAIPAFLGQKKGAQDSNAKSLLRNAAIALESHYADIQAFSNGAATPAIMTQAQLQAVEPNINWIAPSATAATATSADAADNEVYVQINGAFDGYSLTTTSKSTTVFAYARDFQAKTAKCKSLTAVPANATAVAACGAGGTW